MDHEHDDSQFHDSEFDVYDLYNACDGVLDNGVPDIRKLNELNNEEREALDVSRLRKIAAHVATGCAECREIIRTLSLTQRVMAQSTTGQAMAQTTAGRVMEESREDSPQGHARTVDAHAVDASYIESRS